ncbi:MAG: hypothetical protein K2Y15_00595 [Burkholderiaceae bacterium]|uniref:hypothetical protein n=1 Tax=Hylemonella sp. TaxID=2066020 RepID=UPI0035AF2690|nr:hypothetical protein [Burkholderiaceae bacterium]
MFLGWLDATESKRFGVSLAKFFLERIPKAASKSDKDFARRVDEVLGKMASQITEFKQQQKLNAYKKAQLANEFKWALKDGGLPSDYADEITSWVTRRLG